MSNAIRTVTWYNRKNGVTYVYEVLESHWDSQHKQARHTRRMIGQIDPETGRVIPNRGRGRPRKSALAAGLTDAPQAAQQEQAASMPEAAAKPTMTTEPGAQLEARQAKNLDHNPGASQEKSQDKNLDNTLDAQVRARLAEQQQVNQQLQARIEQLESVSERMTMLEDVLRAYTTQVRDSHEHIVQQLKQESASCEAVLALLEQTES